MFAAIIAALTISSAPVTWDTVDQAVKNTQDAKSCDVYSLDLRRTIVELELVTAEMDGKDLEPLLSERQYLARAIVKCEFGKTSERNRILFEEAYPSVKAQRESGRRVP